MPLKQWGVWVYIVMGIYCYVVLPDGK